MKIFKNINQDNKSTEEEVLLKLDGLFEDGKVGHLNNKEELIRFLFKVYFYKRSLRPYIPIVDYLFRLVLIVLIIYLFGLATYGTLYFHPEGITEIYKSKWIQLSNVAYLLILLYIPIRIFSYIRLILRNEIKKDYGYIFGMGFLKFLLFIVLINFTWFIGATFGSFYSIIDVSINEFIK